MLEGGVLVMQSTLNVHCNHGTQLLRCSTVVLVGEVICHVHPVASKEANRICRIAELQNDDVHSANLGRH